MVPLRFKYIPQAKRRLATPQTPQAVKQIIYSCGVLPEARPSVHNITQYRTSERKKCFLCPRSKDKKYPCNNYRSLTMTMRPELALRKR